MTEAPIKYLNFPIEGNYCNFLPNEDYIPDPRIVGYERQASYSPSSMPTRRYYIDRRFSQYDRFLRFQGKTLTTVLYGKLSEQERIYMLDVGCGEGNALQLPRGLRARVQRYGITASDFRSLLKRLYHDLNKTRIITGNAEKLTDYFPRDVFDVVVSMQALRYMDQYQAISGIVDVLKPGGIAMLEEGLDTLAARIPRVTDSESYEWGVTFRKSAE